MSAPPRTRRLFRRRILLCREKENTRTSRARHSNYYYYYYYYCIIAYTYGVYNNTTMIIIFYCLWRHYNIIVILNITTTGETTPATRAQGIEECTTMTCSVKCNRYEREHSEKPSIRVYIGQCLIRVYKGHTIYQQPQRMICECYIL